MANADNNVTCQADGGDDDDKSDDQFNNEQSPYRCKIHNSSSSLREQDIILRTLSLYIVYTPPLTSNHPSVFLLEHSNKKSSKSFAFLTRSLLYFLLNTATHSTCSSLSKLIFKSSSIIGSLKVIDFSHCPLGCFSS